MDGYRAYVGLDVHKETIAVAVAWPGRAEPEYRGILPNRSCSLMRLIRSLQGPHEEALGFAYEAGPCGYGVYREITGTGHDCQVVAPSLIPRKPGDRVKTDRRDAVSLARLHRAGELTAVWVPGPDQEAIRDLTRAREDMKAIELKARQRLGAFLLRHGRVYGGKSRWTQAHFHWLEDQRFDLPVQQVVLQEYVDAVMAAQARTAGLEVQMHEALESWTLRPTVEALMSLRGVATITAMTVLAELGDLTRFDSPRQLVGFLGLAPSEHSSGSRRRRGGDHQGRQRPRPSGVDRIGMGLPLPGQKDGPPATQGRQDCARGAGHRLGGAEAPVWPVHETLSCRKAQVRGEHRHRTRTRRLHLGDRLRSGRQGAWHPGGCLSREHAEVKRNRNRTGGCRRESGCEWPVRRTLGGILCDAGPSRARRLTIADRGSSATK